MTESVMLIVFMLSNANLCLVKTDRIIFSFSLLLTINLESFISTSVFVYHEILQDETHKRP